MESNYTGLHAISVVLKVLSIIIVVAGVGIGIGLFGASSTSSMSILVWGGGILWIVEIIVAFIVGIGFYAYGELIDCFISIESNTRATYINTKPNKDNIKNSITEKQSQIAELQAQVAEELKKQ